MRKVQVLAIGLLSTLLIANAETTPQEELGAGANTQSKQCLLEVKGKKYIDGICKYEADPDGSFRIFGKEYFVYFNTFNDGTAGASWNADPKSTHAQAPLGEDFKRDGNCWSNQETKICVWDKKEATVQKKKRSKPQPIQFARGAYSANVTGKLDGFESEKSYTIGVGKGQTMTIEPVDQPENHHLSVYVTDPKGENANDMDLSCHSSVKVAPTLKGTYTIQVRECTKADPWQGDYTLKVTVK